ncbi:putative reverse transcriptase [Nephila pilipes]|uniref:Putative reverse transcriptase n=1 Tax=Nephila pilipes TaxID=299642 RepID=A0A8X6QPE3_NEPPI|nr:putative reverse transcriptase [Nephila pilipes]
MEEIAKRINDKDIMCMIKLILKIGGKRGIAHGSPLSPLLSNIYLNEIDKMEKAKGMTKEGNVWNMPDDLVILIREYPKRKWLEREVYRRLEEE